MFTKNKTQFQNFLQTAIIGALPIIVVFFGVCFPWRMEDNFKPAYLLVIANTDGEDVDKKDEDKDDDIKDEIKDLKKDIKKIEKAKQKDEGEAQQIRSTIYSVAKNINSLEGQIKKYEETLGRLDQEIKAGEEEIARDKKILSEIVRKINKQNLEIQLLLLDNRRGMDDYIRNRDLLNDLKDRLVKEVDILKEKRRELEKEKEEAGKLKDELAGKRKDLEKQKVRHAVLLDMKNQEIKEKENKIKAINRKINALQSALSSFLGKSFNAKDIVEAVRFASKKTGVRKEFLMAMLDKETDLGRFTGGCTYKNTKMRTSDKKEFKKICKELGYNYKKKKISCALSYGYGGAMGVAQFMPTTWIGYKSTIARYTGHNPPDPWNLTDGVMAMAEKLRRAGANKKSREHYAAKAYYCGGPSSRYWNTHCEAYADTVISWAKGGYKEYF
jgi:membrane-bound lytic murein transglycosylase B